MQGVDSDNFNAQIANADDTKIKSYKHHVIVKSNISTDYIESQVEYAFDKDYSNDSTTLAMANVDNYDTTQSEDSKI
ncbi:hypothetical protein IDZ49_11120 [Francisella tularensis]|nr:hypothetical protein [Francisella tularensis]